MATSGSVNFSMTRDEIISDALNALGVLGTGQSIEPDDLTKCNRALNRLIKWFENYALHVWKRSEFTLFLQQDQSEYQLGGSSSDHATESFDQTALSGDEASGQTVLSIDSNSGMTNGDYIGIVLDDGSTHWTTIVSSTSTTVTITDALADDASSDNIVFSYTSKINKPLDVYDVRRRLLIDDTDCRMKKFDSYEQYQGIPTKSDSGTPYQWTYARLSPHGILYVWQPPEDASYILKVTYAKPIEDFDAASDTPDFPQEWYDVLVYGLAVRVAGMFGRTGTQQYQDCKSIYSDALVTALSFDVENGHVSIKPDPRLSDD